MVFNVALAAVRSPRADTIPPTLKHDLFHGQGVRPWGVSGYTDGVRYNSILSCATDSLTGFWLINMVSFKRHLIVSVRTAKLR
eukprot:3879672-Pyramimonas_sp.AAC.1